jgi:hypothetical protein
MMKLRLAERIAANQKLRRNTCEQETKMLEASRYKSCMSSIELQANKEM